MEFYKAFPIAVIDEDYEGKSAAGRGMRSLAEGIEKEGYRVVAGLTYEDARRLVNVFNTESCWLISVDGTESSTTRWEILAELLAAKRSRNNLLPIFCLATIQRRKWCRRPCCATPMPLCVFSRILRNSWRARSCARRRIILRGFRLQCSRR